VFAFFGGDNVQTINERLPDVEAVASCASKAVRDYPLTSMLVVFGVGMAVGLVLVDSLEETVSKALDAEPSAAEKLAHQIGDALKAALPEAMRRQFVA